MRVLQWIFAGLLISVLSAQAEWKTETAYDVSFMWYMGDRYMVQATDGTIHVAAGGDSLYHLWYDGSQWYRETVDEYWCGSQASLAMDASGYLHIAYLNWKNNDLMYATNQSGSWVTQVVDAADDTGWYTSIAVDGFGKVHISYTTYTAAGWQLMYAAGGNGTWASETVDATVPYVGEETSLQVDAEGTPHISYVDASSKSLKYATKSSGAWLLQQVDAVTSYNGVTDTSLTVKSDGTVAIAYGAGNGVKLATQSSAGWTVQTVADVSWSWDVTLVEDAAGREHVAYSHSGALGYATNVSGVWQPEQIQGMPHADIGLLVDTNAKVHMMAGSYFDDLMYVTNSGGTWQVQTAADNDWIGYDYPAVIDTNDRIHSVLVTDKRHLVYTNNSAGTWESEFIEELPNLAVPDIAVDANGSVHGVYTARDYPNNQLYYFTNRGGTWTKTLIGNADARLPKMVLDGTGTVITVFSEGGNVHVATRQADGSWQSSVIGLQSEIGYWLEDVALDANEHLHLLLTGYELLNGIGQNVLNHVYYDGTAWQKENVRVANSNFIYGSSMAFDSLNNLHIVYQESVHGNPNVSTVYYATNVSGSWMSEAIDTWNYVSANASIAMDSQDNAHLVYMKWDDGLVYYANNMTGTWVVESFPQFGWGGYNSTVLVDSADYVHIVHPDWDHADLLHTYQPAPAVERVDYPGNSENGILCKKGDRGAQVIWDETGHHVYKPEDANKANGKKSSEKLFYNPVTGECEPRL